MHGGSCLLPREMAMYFGGLHLSLAESACRPDGLTRTNMTPGLRSGRMVRRLRILEEV